jgi:type IV pilus assembly protein PilB
MRKKIGEVFVEAGLISQEQLMQALMLQKGGNKRLGKVLIGLGYLDESQIAGALSKQLSLPIVDCSKYNVPKEIIDLIPKDVAEKKIILPLEVKNKTLLVVMADPLDWPAIDELAFRTGLKIAVAVAPETAIVEAIEQYYLPDKEDNWDDMMKDIPTYEHAEILKGQPDEDNKDVNVQTLYNISEAPPIVKLVTMIIVDAVKSRASDIHLEPHENYVQVRYRVDGNLRNTLKYPKNIKDAVISRVKIISNLDITNRRTPQDGRSTLRLDKKDIDLRISSLPSVHGENMVIRLLDHSTGLVSLGNLGIHEKLLTPFLRLASQSQGMILITGPTGSGKTTTLYSLLQQLRTESESIFTIEDPVEYKIPGLTQVGVNEAVGLSFPGALRSVLRQDPDIIMVGEIRDRETADIAIRSALTGHLVLSTVHTNDTISTITRLLDLGIDAYLVASSVSGLLAQRLVRRICTKCREITTPPLAVASFGFPPLKDYYKGKGCPNCQYTGYRGQVGIYEFVQLDTKMKRLIPKLASEEELWAAAREAGTHTLFEDAWIKVKEGITTVDEVLAKVPFGNVETTSRKSDDDQKMKVLAYNVQDSLAEMITEALSGDYEVVFSAKESLLEAAARENPDMIISGKFDNVTSQLKMLRGNIRYAYMPVFIFTDVDESGDPEKAKLRIREILLSSPFDAGKLLTIVNSELSQG